MSAGCVSLRREYLKMIRNVVTSLFSMNLVVLLFFFLPRFISQYEVVILQVCYALFDVAIAM